MSNSNDNPRRSFSVLRWMSLVALVAWPFTAIYGLLDLATLTIALLFGLAWHVTLLFAWRLRSQLLLSLQFMLLVIGPKMLGLGLSSLPTYSFLQWLLAIIIVAGMPLFLFPSWYLRLTRLDTFPPAFQESTKS